MKNQPSLPLRTGLKSGDIDGDLCYISRNSLVASCALKGWPQNSYRTAECVGNNAQRSLIECLKDKSKEENWYTAFPGCTSNQQCYDTRPGYTEPVR